MAEELERWRELFRGAGAGIFDVIEHAIVVAASDSPKEFRHRRDSIAEKLYTVLAPPCLSCAAAAVPEEDKGSVRRVDEKQSKVDNGSDGALGEAEEEEDDDDSDDERLRRAAASNYGQSYDDDGDEEDEDHEEKALEALTNEIDEETQTVCEVLRIKELLLQKEDQSYNTLFDSLRRLQLMQLSVETLKATEIGRAVIVLRKHNSQEIRHLVHTLIEDWKVLVDEWVSATSAAIADNSPDSAVDDGEGLPSPPLDEGAFFATQTTSIQLSKFFDEMDDDGNLRNNNNGSLENKRENKNGRPANHALVKKQEPPQPLPGSDEKVKFRRQELPTRQELPMRQTNPQRPQASSSQVRPHGTLNKQSKPLSSEYGPGRPLKAANQQNPYGEMKPRQSQDHTAVERKTAAVRVDKSRLPAQPSAGVKLGSAKQKMDEGFEDNSRLEAAKRKLHERYQEAENAKKQRTIQVMELGDIPKPKHQNRQPMMKSRNNIRSWANGRR